MVVNFRTRGINRGTRKLARTPMLIKKKTSIKIHICSKSTYVVKTKIILRLSLPMTY
jgi:hypothetical protein